jgi:hypothetical protein
MITRFNVLILSAILSIFLFGTASADIYQLPKKQDVYENTTSEVLTEDLVSSQQEYKVRPIDSGYEDETPSSSDVKTGLVNKSFVAASKTFTLGQL